MFGGHKIISLCISRLNDERNFKFIQALNSAILESDFRLFIYQTCSDLYWHTVNEKGEVSVFELIDYNVTDLLIVFDEAFHDKSAVENVFCKAKEHNTPIISVGKAYEETVSFEFDYRYGFEQIVRHVVEDHGITDLHFIAGVKGEVCSEERLAVFHEILEEKNIDVDDDMISYGDYWVNPTAAAVEKLINENQLPRCFICANDNMAVIVCSTLKKHGIIPVKDVLVTGFDGTDEASWTIPSITTAECDYIELGKNIVIAAEKIFRGEPVNKINNIYYNMRLADSCGCHESISTVGNGEIIQHTRDRFHRYQDDEHKLYEMNVNLLSVDSPEEFSKKLNEFNFYDICILVNNDVLDFSINPEISDTDGVFDDDMLLLFRANTPGDYPKKFARKDIMPDAETLLNRKYPYVFSALNFMDNTCGYMCFYFALDFDNYCKIQQYVISINNAVNGFRNIKHQQYMAKHIADIYKHDYLTGLFNRKSFYIELDNHFKYASGQNILVAVADIDGLKYINDNYSHEDGDFVISSVAEALKNVPVERKICARFGGDELTLCAVAENFNEHEIITYISEFIEQINQTSGKPYKVSASIGICIRDSENFDFDETYKIADKRMYSDKLTKPHRRTD